MSLTNSFQDVTEARAGDIFALFGIDCASGDTFTSDNAPRYTMVNYLELLIILIILHIRSPFMFLIQLYHFQ